MLFEEVCNQEASAMDLTVEDKEKGNRKTKNGIKIQFKLIVGLKKLTLNAHDFRSQRG